jgi:hypothetical protein
VATPGAVCRISGETLLIQPDGVARNAGDAFDLTLGGAALEQRPDGGLQMWLQDVHSVVPLDQRVESNVLPVGPRSARHTGFNASDHRGQGGAVWVAISGALWVAAGAMVGDNYLGRSCCLTEECYQRNVVVLFSI